MDSSFHVRRRQGSLSSDCINQFAEMPVAAISDAMSGMASIESRLRPYHASGKLCGPAITVRCRPGDNIMVHMAIHMAVQGDIIVVDAEGETTVAIVGGRMIEHCVARKIGGLIVFGAIRDSEWIGGQNFPVYACGVSHRKPTKHGPGQINAPVSLGSILVGPGDLIVGDHDGLICVPYRDAAALYARVAEIWKQERAPLAAQRGYNVATQREYLASLGCQFEE